MLKRKEVLKNAYYFVNFVAPYSPYRIARLGREFLASLYYIVFQHFSFKKLLPEAGCESNFFCRLVSDTSTTFLKSSGNYDKLMNYALRIISKKRYTQAAMIKKLKNFSKKHGLADSEIDRVITRLLELNYLDDEKYAEDFILSKLRIKPAGKFFLKGKLRLKGINAEIIDSVLSDADLDEFNLAIKALDDGKRRWGKYPLRKQREKAFRFLTSRGFESDAIYKAIKECYDLPS